MTSENNQAGFSHRVIPLSLVFLLLGGALAAKPPKIRSILPLAALPGETTELLIAGEDLEAVTGLWTSFDSKTTILAGDKDKGRKLRIRIEIPKGTPVGIGAVRASGPGGLSNLGINHKKPL